MFGARLLTMFLIVIEVSWMGTNVFVAINWPLIECTGGIQNNDKEKSGDYHSFVANAKIVLHGCSWLFVVIPGYSWQFVVTKSLPVMRKYVELNRCTMSLCLLRSIFHI